jgi:hypothetical protein
MARGRGMAQVVHLVDDAQDAVALVAS